MEDLYFDAVQCTSDLAKPVDFNLDASVSMCLWPGYVGFCVFPIWLIYKLGKANDPNRLQLSHRGGKHDDPRGPENRVIAAPSSHTSV